MTINLPEFENVNQDISSQLNINSLVQKYISPIQKIRSLAKITPTGIKSNLLSEFGSVTIENEPQESLAHAFYRYLGLPVIAPDGSFYSPGFQPGEIRKIKRKQEIANKLFGSELESMLFKRESLFQEKKSFFAFQDLRSSLLGVILKIPKSFNVFDPSKGPLEKDQQTFSILERKKEVENFIARNPQIEQQILNAQKSFSSSCFSSDLTRGQHILKPFSLHPKIENSILPDDRQICVPFLSSKEKTNLSFFSDLLRPGIELLIQERISPSTNQSWFSNFKKLLSNNKSTLLEEEQFQDLKNSISALLLSSEINNETILSLLDQNENNILIFDQIIKTIRFLVQKLVQALQSLDQIESEINWYPVFSPLGPIAGQSGSFLLSGNSQSFPLEQKILELRIKKLDHEKGNNISIENGSFASPFEIQNSNIDSNLYSKALDEALQTKFLFGQQGFRALQEIEYITGEISGLGLIDVLIFYAALWIIPLSSLLGFLDFEAYNRVKNMFPSLSSNTGRDDIFISLQNLEKNIFNLQNFADRLVEEEKMSLHKL